jgi:transmembrane sensor
MKKNASGQPTTGNIGEPEAAARAELEAVQWVVRMSSGEATEADRAAFAQWRSRSPGNEAELALAYKLWLGTGLAFSARAKTRTRRRRSLLALAASVLVVVLGYQALQSWRGDEAGRRSDLALGGGTQLKPGAAAVLDLDDAAGHCRLLLGRGEAYFDVTPNPDRPVAGAAAETQVRMLDAAFSIRPYAAGVLVTVTGGRIEVNNGKAAQVLTSGQQLRCRAVRHETALRAAPKRAARGRGIAVTLKAAGPRGAPDGSASNRLRDVRKHAAHMGQPL